MAITMAPLIQQGLLEHHNVQMSGTQSLNLSPDLLNDDVIAVQPHEGAPVLTILKDISPLEGDVRTERVHPVLLVALVGPPGGDVPVVVPLRDLRVETAVGQFDVVVGFSDPFLDGEAVCCSVRAFGDSSTFLDLAIELGVNKDWPTIKIQIDFKILNSLTRCTCVIGTQRSKTWLPQCDW